MFGKPPSFWDYKNKSPPSPPKSYKHDFVNNRKPCIIESGGPPPDEARPKGKNSEDFVRLPKNEPIDSHKSATVDSHKEPARFLNVDGPSEDNLYG